MVANENNFRKSYVIDCWSNFLLRELAWTDEDDFVDDETILELLLLLWLMLLDSLVIRLDEAEAD